MRHRKRTAKLGRQFEHRNAMLANMVCSLIKHKRIQTTLAKAKAVRSVAEKMVTLGKSGSIHDRRLASARLHQEDAVRILFSEIAPTHKERNGGYTRIIRLNQRQGDAAELAILEWVDIGVAEPETPKAEKPEKTKAEKPEKTRAEAGEKKPKTKRAKKKTAKEEAKEAK
jgi:large subunit ribosomal protein L17